MTSQSEIQRAEIEIQALLAKGPGVAMNAMFEAYATRSGEQKDVFVAALIGRVAVAEARRRASAI